MRGYRLLLPQVTSERNALGLLVVGFLTEAGTEVYQILTSVGSVRTAPLGYYLSIAVTLVGFYFLWRGLYGWSRLYPHRAQSVRRGPRGSTVAMFAGGVLATAFLNIALGTVGSGDTPPLLAWVVGGVMVAAIGTFFLRLRGLVAPLQGSGGEALGWAAFVWALGVSAVAGLELGLVIIGVFGDFFTDWVAMLLALAPFIFAIAPLCVPYGLLSIAYAAAYGGASREIRPLGSDPATSP